MAEVDTNFLSSQHSDIRREAAEHRATIQLENMKGFDRVNADVLKTASDIRYEQQRQANDLSRQMGFDTNEIVKEGLKESFHTRGDIKDSRHDVSGRINESRADLSRQIDAIDDTLTKQNSDYFIANQQYAFQHARDVASLKATTDMGLQKLAGDIITQGALGQAATALEAAKNAAATALGLEKVASAVALGQNIIERTVVADGQRTRDLINDLKYHDLNRALVERNTELVDERHGRRHWRHVADQSQYQGQWAALQNQLQAFQSQLQETRQGMVNFGTMAGVGQSSTSNNVR